MGINEVKETILSMDTLISERMKKYIHYRSIRNFVIHYDEIQSGAAKEKIRSLLEEYIEEVKAYDYDFEGEASLQLARKYIAKISGYYREYSNFMGIIKIQVILLFGILGDGLLFITGISAKIWHILYL